LIQVKLFTISPASLRLVAQDRDLDANDMRAMLVIMSEHDRGPVTCGQAALAAMLNMDPGNFRRICIKLEKLGYIIRQKNTRGAVISIVMHPNIMFMGRRNQERNRMQESHHDSIKEKRRRYYERLAKDPTDYPNYGKAVWPGLGPGRTDWVYKGDEVPNGEATEEGK